MLYPICLHNVELSTDHRIYIETANKVFGGNNTTNSQHLLLFHYKPYALLIAVRLYLSNSKSGVFTNRKITH